MPPIVLLDEGDELARPRERDARAGCREQALRGKTVLVIAHRLRTVAGADQIVVLDGGRVAEQGTHAELMAAGGLYSRLVRIQAESLGWSVGSTGGR